MVGTTFIFLFQVEEIEEEISNLLTVTQPINREAKRPGEPASKSETLAEWFMWRETAILSLQMYLNCKIKSTVNQDWRILSEVG